MKDRIIKIGVLTAVFIVAVIVFSFITNQGNSDMTVEMNAATFPTISSIFYSWPKTHFFFAITIYI